MGLGRTQPLNDIEAFLPDPEYPCLRSSPLLRFTLRRRLSVLHNIR